MILPAVPTQSFWISTREGRSIGAIGHHRACSRLLVTLVSSGFVILLLTATVAFFDRPGVLHRVSDQGTCTCTGGQLDGPDATEDSPQLLRALFALGRLAQPAASWSRTSPGRLRPIARCRPSPPGLAPALAVIAAHPDLVGRLLPLVRGHQTALASKLVGLGPGWACKRPVVGLLRARGHVVRQDSPGSAPRTLAPVEGRCSLVVPTFAEATAARRTRP